MIGLCVAVSWHVPRGLRRQSPAQSHRGRLSDYCEGEVILPEKRGGFRPQRSKVDMMSVVRRLGTRRLQRAWGVLPARYKIKIYDRPGVRLRLKVRFLKSKVVETLLYGFMRALQSDYELVPW